MGCLADQPEVSESDRSEVDPPPPRPVLPDGLTKLPLRQRLKAIQQFISSFEYNYTPQTYFNVRKKRPLKRIVDTGRQIIRDALPIKCVEAVFLAIFLTSGLDVDRIPLGFKTVVDGQEYRHIVLIVRSGGRYGALGISRRKELMFKDLVYDSLGAIVTDFKQSYERWWHTVLKIRVGLPVEHDVHSQNPVCWRYLMLKTANRPWEECCAALNAHAVCASRLWDKWAVSQAELALRSKRSSAVSTSVKGRLSPDSEPDNVAASTVLSDGPLAVRSAGRLSVARNGAKRPAQNGKRVSKQNGLVTVKSAPDLAEIIKAEEASRLGAGKTDESNEKVRHPLRDCETWQLEIDIRTAVRSCDVLTAVLNNCASESESDSDAPTSPPPVTVKFP